MIAAAAVIFFPAAPVHAQIGGKTAANGPFTLDNVEDLDTTAGGVMRTWIPDFVFGSADPFQAVLLSGSGLTLAPDQSPVGALRFSMPTYFGYVDYGFGVPMPSIEGGSTLTHPGDITSFTHLTFLVRASINLADQKKEVILTTYPGPNYPTLHWNYTISAGTTFQRVTVDLNNPTYILNGGALTTAQMLAQTRFLYFYFYGGPETIPRTLTVHVDDIQLLGPASVADWTLY